MTDLLRRIEEALATAEATIREQAEEIERLKNGAKADDAAIERLRRSNENLRRFNIMTDEELQWVSDGLDKIKEQAEEIEQLHNKLQVEADRRAGEIAERDEEIEQARVAAHMLRNAKDSWHAAYVEERQTTEAQTKEIERLTGELTELQQWVHMSITDRERHDRYVCDERIRELEAALRENVGDSYNLLTQGESPTQRRGPSAQRIYDRSRAALAATPEQEGE
jgi:chromosome segregation ATPase